MKAKKNMNARATATGKEMAMERMPAARILVREILPRRGPVR
jgi:hypothetical protein